MSLTTDRHDGCLHEIGPDGMSSVQFFCAGNPVQQGNLRTNPSGISYHTDKGLKEWRQVVAMTARSLVTPPPQIAYPREARGPGEWE